MARLGGGSQDAKFSWKSSSTTRSMPGLVSFMRSGLLGGDWSCSVVIGGDGEVSLGD